MITITHISSKLKKLFIYFKVITKYAMPVNVIILTTVRKVCASLMYLSFSFKWGRDVETLDLGQMLSLYNFYICLWEKSLCEFQQIEACSHHSAEFHWEARDKSFKWVRCSVSCRGSGLRAQGWVLSSRFKELCPLNWSPPSVSGGHLNLLMLASCLCSLIASLYSAFSSGSGPLFSFW